MLIAPVLALIALAALDLLTAHGSGHFTGSILHARSAGDLRDVIVRRYSAAFGELHNHAMPVATLLALAVRDLGSAPARATARARRRRPRLAGRAVRRPRRGRRRRARGGLRPGPARRRRLRPDLRARLPVGTPRRAECYAAQSRQAPCSTISCSDTANGTRSLSVAIARSSAGSENGITTPHSSHTRW